MEVVEGVLIGLVPAPAALVGVLLPLGVQAANENASKKRKLRAMNQLFRCHTKLFIEFSSLIGFRVLLKIDKVLLRRFRS
jgi:hypothetical protein